MHIRPMTDADYQRCHGIHARRFYQRHGFCVVTREDIDFFGRRLPSWLMRKNALAPGS